MKLLIASTVLIFSFGATAGHAGDAETARDIMQKVEDRPDGRDSAARTVIAMTDRFGETHQTEILRIRKDFGPELQDQFTFSLIVKPAELAGTRVLTRDYYDAERQDDQWIMIPGIDEIKRIAVDSYTSRLMGSDITYGDLSTRDLDNYDFTLVGEEKVGGWNTTVIRFKPRTKEEIARFGYLRGKVWVDTNSFLVVRSIFDLVEPGQQKLFMTHAMAQVDGYWSPTDMTFVTQIEGNVVSSTRMKLHELKFDIGVDETLFKKEALLTVSSADELPVSF